VSPPLRLSSKKARLVVALLLLSPPTLSEVAPANSQQCYFSVVVDFNSKKSDQDLRLFEKLERHIQNKLMVVDVVVPHLTQLSS